jgi:hypothetical protein
MKIYSALALGLLWIPCASNAGVFNLATFTCESYENQILNPAPAQQSEDAINFAMWLFGFTAARAGGHAIDSNGLQAFGNALDADCKSRPAASLLDAVAAIKPANVNSLNLNELDCATFESRHEELLRSDPESAKTIMMWLFGFTVGKAGGHVFDTAAVTDFAKTLATQCIQHAQGSLFDALSAVKIQKKKPS